MALEPIHFTIFIIVRILLVRNGPRIPFINHMHIIWMFSWFDRATHRHPIRNSHSAPEVHSIIQLNVTKTNSPSLFVYIWLDWMEEFFVVFFAIRLGQRRIKLPFQNGLSLFIEKVFVWEAVILVAGLVILDMIDTWFFWFWLLARLNVDLIVWDWRVITSTCYSGFEKPACEFLPYRMRNVKEDGYVKRRK